MANVEEKKDRHCPKKVWGHEEWIVNNDLYCGKRLHFDEIGGSTSLHFHVKKHETMYVEKGMFCITIVNPLTGLSTDIILYETESIVIEPNTVHRIMCKSPKSILVEFSTHHEDGDSYRVSPPRT